MNAVHFWWQCLAGLLSLGLAGHAAAQTAPAAASSPPPVEAFFKPAKMQGAAMSPSGRWLAALTDIPGKRKGLLVIDLDDAKAASFIPVSEEDDLLWFNWVSDDWLIGGLNNPNNRGTKSQWDGMLAIKRDGSLMRQLISRTFEPEGQFRRRTLDPDHDLLALGAPGSNEVIVGQWVFQERSNELLRVVPKVLNVATSTVRNLVENGPSATGWTFDHRGRARVAFDTKEGLTTVWWADTQGNWKQLRKSPQYEAPWSVLALDGDDGLLVGTEAPGDGSLEIRRYDFAANAPAVEPLMTTPGFDSGVQSIRDRDSGKLFGLGVLTDAAAQVWFGDAMRNVQKLVDAKFPRTVNLIRCQPCDGNGRLLVHSYSDTDPGTYSLYLPQTKQWQLLGEVRPEIDPRRMAPMALHRTQARDGRDLPVWITRPRPAAGQKAGPAPAVVLVHGGPWLRGTQWAFDSEVQFLASRGYVVIQPEFRGSEGYGSAHFRAGWKQWGHKMQDDISDALKFAVAKGWADPGRACIMGGSYGGYAALMGLAKDPDQYRCGVALAAVSDPRNMFDFHWSDITGSGRKYSLPLLIGDRQKDEALMIAGSPLEQASRIKSPLLLVHGALDRRVPIDNAERMRDALLKAGKPVEWVRYPNASHGFYFDDDKFDYYRRVEAFLARHLQP